MNYFMISDTDGSFKGYTNSEEIKDKFLKERGVRNYNVTKVSGKKLNPKLIKEIENSHTEIVICENTTLFPMEEEYFIEAVEQYFIDVQCNIDYIQKMEQNVIFDSVKDEKKVNLSLQLIDKIIKEIVKKSLDEYVPYDYNERLRMEDMAKFVANQF